MFFKKLQKQPTIVFRCRPDMMDAIPRPAKSQKFFPDWLKALPKDLENSGPSDVGSIKRCIPVLEACSQGFIIPLWGDLHVKVTGVYNLLDKDGKLIATVNDVKEPDLLGKNIEGFDVASIEEDGKHIWCKFPEGFDGGAGADITKHTWEQVGEACDLKNFSLGRVLLKFSNPWVIETQDGWSVQFKNPANSWKHNIEIIEGVVDTDTYQQQINFPYVWTGDEIGEWVIPRGTPLIQVIPFKRESVKMGIGAYDIKKISEVNALLSSTFKDRYRRFFWHKRSK
jgi:hypothetical protein